MRPVDRLVDDIGAGTLPPVTWVTPRFELSDHPPFSTGHRAQLDHRHRERRDEEPGWEHTAIFLTWDEWGGFYDPVAAARGRPRRPRLPRAAARHQPVHAQRPRRRRAGRVLDAAQVHRRQLGPRPTSPRGSRTPTTSSTSSTSRRSRAPRCWARSAPPRTAPRSGGRATRTPAGKQGTTPVENPL